LKPTLGKKFLRNFFFVKGKTLHKKGLKGWWSGLR
jgi:hypothetical protein